MAPHQEAFYGGAASGGKSEALLMGALQYVDDPNYAALIIRRSYTQLAQPGALMDRARSWLKDTSAKWDRENHSWRFPSGASLTFGYIATPADRFNFQSAEYQYVAFDEVTDFPDDVPYTFLFSRLRRKTGMEHIPLRMRSASNPVGPGVHWVKQRFIDEQDSKRIYIPAGYRDNPHVDQDSYRESLDQLHPALQDKLLHGDWEAVEDAAFPEFDKSVHVIPPITAPLDWRRWEAMDWGTTNPTAWLAGALSPEGDTIVFGEYYKPGLISDHASNILTLRSLSWGQPSISLADPSIIAATGFGTAGRGETVHSEFAKNGVHLVPANNDRRAGRVRVSEMLRIDPSRTFPDWHPRRGEQGAPRLYLTENCVNTIDQLQRAPLDSVLMETVDPYFETRYGHAMAALRYLVTARVYPADVVRPANEGRRANTWADWNKFRDAGWDHVG
jgi:hypothetical protein